MLFKYEVRSNCGIYTGNLHISTVDSISADTVRKVIVCYTDDYAKHIDLYQVLGIIGADGNNGRFIGYDIPAGKDVTTVEQTGIMNAYKLFDPNSESETYTFRYLPAGNNSCVSNKMEVTIIVTKDINTDSEFKRQ
jgi:hypothetical protein